VHITAEIVGQLSVNPVQSHPKPAYSNRRGALISMAVVVLCCMACSAHSGRKAKKENGKVTVLCPFFRRMAC
jgi:hypothetical protein